MHVYYISILLFAIPLNILVSSPQKNPSIITPHHTPRYTSRVLSEKEIKSTNYDNDPQMKKVMKKFQDRTSERLREYDERMKEKRQKSKEERDKRTQEIIEKDKMEKSLAEKVEKGCLKCGLVLGGGVLPVWGMITGLWYATWSQYVAIAVAEAATNAGIKAGVKVGLTNVTKIVTKVLAKEQAKIPTIKMLETLTKGISADNVTFSGILKAINSNGAAFFDDGLYSKFSMTVQKLATNPKPFITEYATQAEVAAVETAFDNAKAGVLTQAGNATSTLTTAITATVVTIVIIVLILVIIYLILRYRRKKKMNKKAQYTKLLKE
ncbi:rifin PIR protein, putative [Plasmodium reichenowi]|uniref:Rifin PIR protein, putative n=1 Tax=Plasmodium reichenowi TaxID=5854 RepID=A0A2P9DHF5_PLARE|nr:rifin PIR protein, putative [Plasmodium reichenowi]